MWARKAIVLLLLAGAQLASILGSKPGDNVESLCNNEPIDLRYRAEFNSLYRQVNSLPSHIKCPRHIIEAIEDMNLVLGDQDENVCTMEKAQSINKFYRKHLDTSDAEVAQTRQELARSLRDFFLAYGMQVSNLCKKNMVKVIVDFSGVDRDEPLIPVVDAQEDVARFLESAGEVGDIFVPNQMDLSAPSNPTNQAHKRLFIQVSSTSQADRARTLCKRRLGPIYEPAVLPLTVLANAGFDFRDQYLQGTLRDDFVAKLMRYWSTVTFICELVKEIGVVGGSQDEYVVLIAEEEAKSRREAAVNSTPDESVAYKEAIQMISEPVFYVTIVNLIYNKGDPDLVKSINNFKTSENVARLMKERLLSSSLQLLDGKMLQKPLKVRISQKLKKLVKKYESLAIISRESVGRPAYEVEIEDIDKQVRMSHWRSKIWPVMKPLVELMRFTGNLLFYSLGGLLGAAAFLIYIKLVSGG